MAKKIVCCKGCEKRRIVCHDTCEQYKKEKDEYNKQRSEEYVNRYKNRLYDDYKVKNIRRMRRLTKND